MSHIAVDLKVIETHAPAVARATEQPVTHIIGALNLLWHRCWVNKTDTITRVGLAGIFGPARLDETIASLVDTHFLEPLADGWRVRGAEKYLRVTDAKSAAGKVRAGSAGRSAGRFTSTSPADHQQTTSSQPALTPSTEHRAPNTSKDFAGEKPPAKPKAPKPEKATDPRHTPLVKALTETFTEVKAVKYPFSPRDASAVSALLATGSQPEEIVNAWRRALHEATHPPIACIHELVPKLPHFIGPRQPGKPLGANWRDSQNYDQPFHAEEPS